MCNVGGIDRIVRIIAGLFLISLVFFGEQIIGQNTIWGWVGVGIIALVVAGLIVIFMRFSRR